MHRFVTLALLIPLFACNQPQATAPESNTAAVAEAEPARAEVPSLEGEWRVTRIDGRDSSGLGMTATFGGGRAIFATGCLRRAWTYSQDRNMVGFTSFPAGSTNCGGGTPGALEETAYAALDKVKIAIFDKDGKQAELSGTGGNLTLERR